MEFQPLTPAEISAIDPFVGLGDRVDYQTRFVISAFIKKKEFLVLRKELKAKAESIEKHHSELSMVPEPNRPPEWIENMGHTSRELSKVRIEIDLALSSSESEDMTIAKVRKELIMINEMHPSAWHTTQVLLDTIEMGLNRPFHPLWK
jgi:hypothetical protein